MAIKSPTFFGAQVSNEAKVTLGNIEERVDGLFRRGETIGTELEDTCKAAVARRRVEGDTRGEKLYADASAIFKNFTTQVSEVTYAREAGVSSPKPR